jgi:dTDP-4-dehydrorhamnose reductase
MTVSKIEALGTRVFLERLLGIYCIIFNLNTLTLEIKNSKVNLDHPGFMNRPKLLITGAGGFLGWYLCQAARSQWDVYGTIHRNPVAIPGITLFKINLLDQGELIGLMQQIRPDAVIHAAALSRLNDCQNLPDLSFAVNVRASLNLADCCRELEIPCVFTSTDQVFNGLHPPYKETDPVSPINLYGEHKVLAEMGMRSHNPQTIICRMPLMFGMTPHAQSFLQPFVKTLQAGQPLQLFTDEVRTPVSGRSAAQGILLALQHRPDYLHLGGPERISRHQLGRMLVHILNLPETLIQTCQQADVPMVASRPADVSLDSTVAFELGYEPGFLEPELKILLLELRHLSFRL